MSLLCLFGKASKKEQTNKQKLSINLSLPLSLPGFAPSSSFSLLVYTKWHLENLPPPYLHSNYPLNFKLMMMLGMASVYSSMVKLWLSSMSAFLLTTMMSSRLLNLWILTMLRDLDGDSERCPYSFRTMSAIRLWGAWQFVLLMPLQRMIFGSATLLWKRYIWSLCRK